jgi:hypothetical protein
VSVRVSHAQPALGRPQSPACPSASHTTPCWRVRSHCVCTTPANAPPHHTFGSFLSSKGLPSSCSALSLGRPASACGHTPEHTTATHHACWCVAVARVTGRRRRAPAETGSWLAWGCAVGTGAAHTRPLSFARALFQRAPAARASGRSAPTAGPAGWSGCLAAQGARSGCCCRRR